MPRRPFVLWSLMAIAAPGAAAHAVIPSLVGETLAGHHIRLPSDIAQPTAILIVGFTQKAAGQAGKWGREIGKLHACGKDEPIEWYEMPVLSSVPRLIRPLVVRAIRSELVPELRSHFVPVYTEEASWKAAMGFSAPDDAYVAIVSGSGDLIFRLQGAFDSDKVSRLKVQLQTACVQR